MGMKSRVIVEDTVLLRCKIWFDMMTDNSWEDIIANGVKIMAYIEVFRAANDKYVKPQNKVWWIEIDTMLADMEVAIDGETAEEDFDLWAQCFGHLWCHIETCML